MVAGMLGCTLGCSGVPLRILSYSCVGRTFPPKEDATRLDLVDELYALPVKMPDQFASWLEDWITKLVVADEVSADSEPRRTMAVLVNVGKPLESTDNIFMTE